MYIETLIRNPMQNLHTEFPHRISTQNPIQEHSNDAEMVNNLQSLVNGLQTYENVDFTKISKRL